MKANEIYMRDPFVYTEGDVAYLVGTTDENAWGGAAHGSRSPSSPPPPRGAQRSPPPRGPAPFLGLWRPLRTAARTARGSAPRAAGRARTAPR